jgi:hypothetical protein
MLNAHQLLGFGLSLALLPATGSCAPPKSPAVPDTAASVSFSGFVESLRMDPERNADVELQSPSVKRAPDSQAMGVVFDGFERWCEAKGGRLLGGAFDDAAEEYLLQRVQRKPKNAGMTISGVACVKDENAIAGFVNVANANVAFYDAAQVAAFVKRYPPGSAKAASEANADAMGHAAKGRLNQSTCEMRTGADCVVDPSTAKASPTLTPSPDSP